MKIIEFLRLVARARSEKASHSEWKNACDYIARDMILQQPNHTHLENIYRLTCKRADQDARVFVKAKRKKDEHSICKIAGCDQTAAQTSHFCEEHRHTVGKPTA